MEASECQHCNGSVEFGQTEQGFRGFVHLATGLAACPPVAEPPARPEPPTCADRIASEMASREQSLADLYEQAEDDDEAQEEIDSYGLGLSVRTVVRLDISTGGPAEWLEVPVERERYGWAIAGPVAFHFADWFDHAETTVDDGSSLYRWAEGIVECMGVEMAGAPV